MEKLRSSLIKRGFQLTWKSAFWRLKTYLFKRTIVLQDRWGFYSYRRWISKHELKSFELEQQKNSNSQLNNRFTYGFLVDCLDATEHEISRSINSLEAQTNPDWQACLLLAPRFAVRAFSFPKSARLDFRPVNSVSIEEMMDAFQDFPGDYVSLFHAGDALSPDFLFEAGKLLSQDPQIDIIYTDEDSFAENGKDRAEPFLKPDWSPELLLSINYLERALFRRELFLPALANAQDIGDAIFRVVEKSVKIVHLPKISVHLSDLKMDRRKYPSEVHLRNVEAHLQRTGMLGAKAEYGQGKVVSVHWPIGSPLVSIIVLTKDRVDYLKNCVAAVLDKNTYPHYELIIVDNGSHETLTRQFYDQLLSEPCVRILENPSGFNFSAFNNFGARHANGDLLLFLNNDIEAQQTNWLEELVRWTERPGVGIVGSKLLYPDGSIQHAGIVIGMEGHASHIFQGAGINVSGPFGQADWYRNYSAVTAACMLVRKDVFQQIGGFSERYALVFNDIEICLRAIRAGFRVVLTPHTGLIHHEGRTRAHYIPEDDILQGYQDLISVIEYGDPYYNPNLSYAYHVPTLKRAREENPVERIRKIVAYL